MLKPLFADAAPPPEAVFGFLAAVGLAMAFLIGGAIVLGLWLARRSRIQYPPTKIDRDTP